MLTHHPPDTRSLSGQVPYRISLTKLPCIKTTMLVAQSLLSSHPCRALYTPTSPAGPTMSLHNRKTALFMTVAEASQSNFIFTLAPEFSNVDGHVVSFPGSRRCTEELPSSARVVERKHHGFISMFQEISGMKPQEAAESKGLAEATWPHPPLARIHEGLNTTITLAASWNGKGTTHHSWFASPFIQTES